MSDAKTQGLTRRSFLKTTGLIAGTIAVAGGMTSTLQAIAVDGEESNETMQEQIFNCNCRSNCMGSCRLLAHVRDGKLVKLEPGDYPNEGYTGCCLKGLTYIERIYGTNRIQYPMRRAGERGADSWERISWDDAIAELATKLKETVDTFGPKAVVFDTASGNYGYINGIYNTFARLSACMGATKTVQSYDYAAGHGIDRVLGTGDWAYCNEPNSVLDSSMVVVWGTNPVFTAPHNWRWMRWAQEQGTKVVTIDPIKSATAHRSDEYIQVKAGNDGYLALAMSNYLIEKDLIDWDFLKKKSTAAFLVRRDTKAHLRKSDYTEVAINPATKAPIDDFYVWDNATNKIALIGDAVDPALEGSFVTEDGVKVDTAFSLLKSELAQYKISEASRLCGLSEEFIQEFTERFAGEDAVSVNITYGLDHYLNGYQNTWSIAILLALTGNLAKPGAGFTGVFTNSTFAPAYLALWISEEFTAYNSVVPGALLPEMFATQTLEGKPYPVKAMVTYSANPLSNLGGQNEFLEKVLPNIDYWAVIDIDFTDSTRYADLVLPAASWYEVEEFRNGYNNPYTIYQEKAIEPLYESKPDHEIISLLGRALGYEASFPEGHKFEDWANLLLSNEISKKLDVSVKTLREKLVIQTTSEHGKSLVRGLTTPYPTESKRVQLYTERPKPRLNYGQDLSERLPHEHIVYYREPEEIGLDNPLREKYPLVYLQEHSRFRVHTQWHHTPILRELDPEPLVKVNSIDAAERGVNNGDVVEVFNDRGRCVIKCLIDESIAPGVISIPKGWQRNQFIEGGYQEMSQPKIDPYPAACSFYDALVDFKKM